MTEPKLQTKLSVLTGTTSESRMTFVWGQEVSPISVGARAEWTIAGNDVKDMHLFVSFDGRQVHVAAAAEDAKVTVRGQSVGQQWFPVPVPSELAFGSVRIAVSCEERDSAAPLGQGATWRVEEGIPLPGLSSAPSEKSQYAERARSGTARLGSIENVDKINAAQQFPAAGTAEHARQPDDRAPIVARHIDIKPTAEEAPHRAAPQIITAPVQVVAAPTPGGVPPFQAGLDTLASEGSTQSTLAAVTPPTGVARPAPHIAVVTPPPPAPAEPVPPSAESLDVTAIESEPISTIHDGGKLRDQANRVQAAAEPSLQPVAQPEVPAAVSPGAPIGFAQAPDVPGAPSSKASGGFAQAWRETSWVKKMILALLPFAAVVGLYPELLESEPAARPPATTKSTATGPAVLSVAPKAFPSTAPSASAHTSVEVAANEPNVAPGRETRTNDVNDSSMLTKTAIDAALSGHHAEAASFYERLAKERDDDPVYQAAARLAREGAVRMP